MVTLMAITEIFNTLVTTGLPHPYQCMGPLSFLGTSGQGSDSFLFHFSMKVKIAKRIAPDGTPRFAYVS